LFNVRKTYQRAKISFEIFSILPTIPLYIQPTVFFLLTPVDDILGRRRRSQPFCEQLLVTNQEYTSKRFTLELRGLNHGTGTAFLKGPEND